MDFGWINFSPSFLIIWRCFNIASGKNELPINDQIKVSELMVIGPNGEQMGVKNINDALTLEIIRSSKETKRN